ncbi:peptidase inhibitor family I36 protein [Saccharopolyspora taberi]|uniref:Peptidase inhibitor family I36 n=1 Tax=Saccharopolyspora taberi TaxID=60895 RepID=A0ABN3VBD8_9PSEU
MFTKRVFAVSAAGVLAAMFSGAVASAQPQDPVQAMAEACDEGKLCVWEGANGQGKRVDFYVCQWEEVQRHGLSRVGSFVNNQTDGTVAAFHGPDPANPTGPWIEQYRSTAFEIRDDDRGLGTYGIQVC